MNCWGRQTWQGAVPAGCLHDIEMTTGVFDHRCGVSYTCFLVECMLLNTSQIPSLGSLVLSIYFDHKQENSHTRSKPQRAGKGIREVFAVLNATVDLFSLLSSTSLSYHCLYLQLTAVRSPILLHSRDCGI
jgi:hypothetical protein